MKKDKNSKKVANELFFSNALEEVICRFPKRSQEIIKMRFGITAKTPQTLESVGGQYQITRERVRQIISEIIKKIKNRLESDPLRRVFQKIEFTIGQNNGIMGKRELLDRLSEDLGEQGVVEFFLECADGFEAKKEKGKLENSIVLADFDLDHWKEIMRKIKLMLEEEKKTFKSKDFFKKVSDKEIGIDKKKLFHYLSVSEEIKRNNFGRWGVARWSEINPKGTREKTFLVMKEKKMSLHYREVANLIDEYKLSKKKTHPQTVHNELIKDSRFVLVGRGKYALAEWGYKKGTVKDVLGEILNRDSGPVKCSDILDEVLSLRQVKKSTVMINLNNFFIKVGKDEYTVKK